MGRKMKTNKRLYIRIGAAVVLLLCSFVPVFAQEMRGEIVYIEGAVDVYRDGAKLDWRAVDIGTFLEPYDMVETGQDGYVEISLTQAGGESSVTVEPDTSFYFDVNDVDGPKKTEFAVMAGSMAFRVKKLTGNEAFQVRTESVAMGVRGTNFQVTVAAEGSILTTCDEGIVECTTEEGGREFSKPGQVVEKITDKNLDSAEVDPQELDAYRNEWVSL